MKDAEFLYPPQYIQEYDLTIYRVPFGMNEEVTPNAEDAGYTAYVREDLTDEEAVDKAKHAIKHIKDRQFQMLSVQQIEADAHSTENEIKQKLEEAKKQEELRKKKVLARKKRLDKRLKKFEERDKWLQDNLGIDVNEMRIRAMERQLKDPF